MLVLCFSVNMRLKSWCTHTANLLLKSSSATLQWKKLKGRPELRYGIWSSFLSRWSWTCWTMEKVKVRVVVLSHACQSMSVCEMVEFVLLHFLLGKTCYQERERVLLERNLRWLMTNPLAFLLWVREKSCYQA